MFQRFFYFSNIDVKCTAEISSPHHTLKMGKRDLKKINVCHSKTRSEQPRPAAVERLGEEGLRGRTSATVEMINKTLITLFKIGLFCTMEITYSVKAENIVYIHEKQRP